MEDTLKIEALQKAFDLHDLQVEIHADMKPLTRPCTSEKYNFPQLFTDARKENQNGRKTDAQDEKGRAVKALLAP
eukprot:288194-Prorocentrum_minimum.AAC.2